MGERRTVNIRIVNLRSDYPHGTRLEFGPFWYRWWLILRHGGKPHAVITGEPCVRFPLEPTEEE